MAMMMMVGGLGTCGLERVLLYPPPTEYSQQQQLYCPLLLSCCHYAKLGQRVGGYGYGYGGFDIRTCKFHHRCRPHFRRSRTKIGGFRFRFRPRPSGDDDQQPPPPRQQQEERETQVVVTTSTVIKEEGEEDANSPLPFPPEANNNTSIISACFVGLLTGTAIVLFNYTVHELRDFFWDGIPDRGASWLREEPIQVVWERVILVPVCGGLIVSVLNFLREALERPAQGGILTTNVKAVLDPILKAVAACFTLGTGNSLGPEGPSVEIGASIAKGVATLVDKSGQKRLSLVAAGSAAGISSGKARRRRNSSGVLRH